MSRSANRAAALVAVLLVASALTAAATTAPAGDHSGLGRTATAAEIKAWDIDVRPDFKGLPPGSGSVGAGETIWIAKCSSCHGDFGDANHVYTPLVGNTTAEDIKTGRVAALREPGRVRTTFTKLATVSTLWDFINRAMPWDRPKSLKADEVYAVLAYLLNLAEIVPADFVLSEKNIAGVQSRMPNRNGMTREHGFSSIKGKPDTHNTACMSDCRDKVAVSSSLPESARSSHGNLLQQNREYGPVRGQLTLPAGSGAAVAAPEPKAPSALLAANACTACHGLDSKVVGPGLQQVAEKHKGRADALDYFKSRIRNGGTGTWGDVQMPPQPQLSEGDLDTIARWLTDGAPR